VKSFGHLRLDNDARLIQVRESDCSVTDRCARWVECAGAADDGGHTMNDHSAGLTARLTPPYPSIIPDQDFFSGKELEVISSAPLSMIVSRSSIAATTRAAISGVVCR
jgi:hypothetical protein